VQIAETVSDYAFCLRERVLTQELFSLKRFLASASPYAENRIGSSARPYMPETLS
jgi:hypothetical protein